jgi:hypothetical protein
MDLFGDMDPYVIVNFNGTKYRTKTKRSAGRFPQWTAEEAQFDIKIPTALDTITLTCYDEDVIYDDYLGETTLKMKQIRDFKGLQEWIDIFIKDKKAGKLKIIAKLITLEDYDIQAKQPNHARARLSSIK